MYPVTDIFISDQGEGHFVGAAMAFVRLAGCSVLDCRIRANCDEAPWKSNHRLDAARIVDTIRGKSRAEGPFAAVCITGGEPTDHDLVPLISALRAEGWPVHLETSGIRSCGGYPIDWLTVSPKTADFVQRVGHTLKLVVMPEWDNAPDGAWSIIKGLSDCTSFFHYYLQPLTIGDRAVNLDQVQRLRRDVHNGRGKWFLSTQAHKVWGVR